MPSRCERGITWRQPLFDGRIQQREPNGDRVGLVRRRQEHAIVLVPGRVVEQARFHLLAQYILRWLDAHVLHGIGINFRSNKRFDRIQQLFVAHHVKDCRADPDWRIWFDSTLGQRKIKILAVVDAALAEDFHQAAAKGQRVVGIFGFALIVELLRQPIQHAFVLVDNGVEVGNGGRTGLGRGDNLRRGNVAVGRW